ncbi:hypothetical protein BDN70DRAFT_901742 [Pholiota conissans]|uniref:Uncharacterized protein n=1 Tax=Pholiota conissans TaxID=109636 RepID=A0A9P6CR90_9AGAR|nr:hypothetical protein BDN70DRAFT_901742 [Pholiota conissans]
MTRNGKQGRVDQGDEKARPCPFILARISSSTHPRPPRLRTPLQPSSFAVLPPPRVVVVRCLSSVCIEPPRCSATQPGHPFARTPVRPSSPLIGVQPRHPPSLIPRKPTSHAYIFFCPGRTQPASLVGGEGESGGGVWQEQPSTSLIGGEGGARGGWYKSKPATSLSGGE